MGNLKEQRLQSCLCWTRVVRRRRRRRRTRMHCDTFSDNSGCVGCAQGVYRSSFKLLSRHCFF